MQTKPLFRGKVIFIQIELRKPGYRSEMRREGAAPLNGSGSREPRIDEELVGEGGLIPDGGGRRGEGGGGDRGGLDFSAMEEIGRRTNLTPCT